MILAPACVMMQLYFFFPGMFLAKKTWLQLGVQATAALVNISICLWLIPMFGFVGAALGNFFAAMIFCVIWASASQNHYPIPFEWRIIFGGVALYAVAIAVGHWVSADLWFAVAIKLGLFVSLGAGLFFLGFARMNELSILIHRLGGKFKRV